MTAMSGPGFAISSLAINEEREVEVVFVGNSQILREFSIEKGEGVRGGSRVGKSLRNRNRNEIDHTRCNDKEHTLIRGRPLI